MLKDNNNIIIVDDNPEDIKRLSNIFYSHGIGCRTIECDGFNMLDEPLKGIKIAFVDMNFSNTGADTAMFATLCQVLSATISQENGPFILVFWTTHTKDIETFKEYVNRDDTYKTLPNPVSIVPLDKSQFETDAAVNLDETLNRICSEPIANCLFSMGEELQSAAEECLFNIVSLIKREDSWGDNTAYTEKIRDLFSKIAIQTAGLENGIKMPDVAIKESLGPVFMYNLLNNDSKVWESFLGLCIEDKEKYSKCSFAEYAPQLNTYYHIDQNVADAETRGVVRLIDCDDEYFKNKIGQTKADWVVNVLFKGNNPFSDDYKIVAIEYSAACDFAQNKNRLRRYIMGVLCSKNDFVKARKKAKSIGENLCSLDFSFIHDSKEYGIIIDLNSSINEDSKDLFGILGNPLFKFKQDVVNKITEQHANHESRFGYSCFH